MKRKLILKRVRVPQIKAFEQYLNKMAQQGWFLKSMQFGLVFEKGEFQELNYHVALDPGASTFDPGLETSKSQEQKEFLEDFGYQFICQSGVLQVYAGVEKQKLYNDEYVDSDTLKKVIFKEMLSYDGYPALIMFLLLVMMFFNKYQQLNILTSNALLFLYGIAALIMIFDFVQVYKSIKFLRNKDLRLDDLKSKFHEWSNLIALMIITIMALYLLPSGMLLFYLILIGLLYAGIFMINGINRNDPVKRFAMMIIVSIVVLVITVPWILNLNLFDNDTSSILVDHQVLQELDVYEIKGFDNYLKNLIITSNEAVYDHEIAGVKIYRDEYGIITATKDNWVVVGDVDEKTIIERLTKK